MPLSYPALLLPSFIRHDILQWSSLGIHFSQSLCWEITCPQIQCEDLWQPPLCGLVTKFENLLCFVNYFAVCFCRGATLSMCDVSLFQLAEDPFNQAHAHPLRLVRSGSSMTEEKGVGHSITAWLQLEGTFGGHPGQTLAPEGPPKAVYPVLCELPS